MRGIGFIESERAIIFENRQVQVLTRPHCRRAWQGLPGSIISLTLGAIAPPVRSLCVQEIVTGKEFLVQARSKWRHRCTGSIVSTEVRAYLRFTPKNWFSRKSTGYVVWFHTRWLPDGLVSLAPMLNKTFKVSS